MENEEISQILQNELKEWSNAKDFNELNKLSQEKAYIECKDDAQRKAVEIARAGSYIIATQAISLNMMKEVCGMMRLYSEIKQEGQQHGNKEKK